MFYVFFLIKNIETAAKGDCGGNVFKDVGREDVADSLICKFVQNWVRCKVSGNDITLIMK